MGSFIILIPFGLYFFFIMSGLFLGIAISYIVCSINFFKNLNYNQKSFSEIKSNSKTLIHNFGVDFLTYAPRFIDKLIIFPIFGLTNLGVYQLNIQILFGLEILPLALHSFLLSEVSSGKKQSKINYFIVLASIIISIAAIFIGPIFVNELFPEYSSGIVSLQILMISIIPLTINYIISAKTTGKRINSSRIFCSC